MTPPAMFEIYFDNGARSWMVNLQRKQK